MRFILTPTSANFAEDMREHVSEIQRIAEVEYIHEYWLEVIVTNKDQHFKLSEYCHKNEINIDS